MEELAPEIRKHTDVEIEAFVHGAMCISTRTLYFVHHMSMRDAIVGAAQSCRWKYDLYDMPLDKSARA